MNRLSLRINRLKSKTKGKLPIILRGIYRMYPILTKEVRRMSTCNRLDLQTLRYKWTGWVWEITGWSWRLQENYPIQCSLLNYYMLSPRFVHAVTFVYICRTNDRGEPAVQLQMNRLSLTNNRLKFKTTKGKLPIILRGIYRTYPTLTKEIRRMWTCNRLDL